MAVSLKKYERQVNVAARPLSGQVSPSAGQDVIKAQAQNDSLADEILQFAGGVASKYFEDKAKSTDQLTLQQYEEAKLDTGLRIQSRVNEALKSGKKYEDVYGGILKDELGKLEKEVQGYQWQYKTNQEATNKNFTNYSMGLDLTNLQNQTQIIQRAQQAGINAEFTEWTNYVNQLETSLFEQIKTADDQAEIQQMLGSFTKEVSRANNMLTDPLNKEKAKVFDESFKLRFEQATNTRLLQIPVEKEVASIQTTMATALYTNDFENKDAGVISIGGVEYQAGPGSSQIIFDAASRRGVELQMFDESERIESVAGFGKQKIFQNFDLAIKQDVNMARGIMESADFPVELLPKATIKLQEREKQLSQSLLRQQNKSTSELVNGQNLARPNVTTSLIDSFKDENGNIRRIEEGGMSVPMVDPTALQIAEAAYASDLKGTRLTDDQLRPYEDAIFELSTLVGTDEVTADTLPIIAGHLKKTPLTAGLYMGMLNTVVTAKELQESFGTQEKIVFTELMNSLPKYVDAYGLQQGVDSHLSLLQMFYEQVPTGNMKVQDFKETTEYQDFVNVQVAANAVERVKTVDDQTSETAGYVEQWKSQQQVK
jgi:hypothetical protein